MSVPWPGDKDKVFREGATWNHTVASLDDWVKIHGREPLLPNAYKEAADMIVSCIEAGETRVHPDMYFFPIAYLYRHSFELSLKALICQGIELGFIEDSDRVNEILGSHGLCPLWNKARVALEAMWPDGPKEDLMNVERMIQEFHNIDGSGQTFRYSKDLKGRPNADTLPKTVDLLEMKRCCGNLFSFLESCGGGLGDAIDWQNDAEGY